MDDYIHFPEFINLDTYVFTFGKHKNETAKTVLQDDPQYLKWCNDNIEWFKLTATDLDRVDDAIKDAWYDNIDIDIYDFYD